MTSESSTRQAARGPRWGGGGRAAPVGEPEPRAVVAPWVLWSAVAATAVATLTLVLWPGTSGDLLVASGLVAGGGAVYAASRASGADRQGWLLLGLGQVLNGLGNISIAVDSAGWFEHGDSASAIVFTGATTATATGMVLLVLSDRSDRLSAGADSLLLLGAVFVVGWAYHAPGTILPGGKATLPALTGLIGVELDLFILAVGVLACRSRPRGQRLPPALAVAAQLSATLADTGVLGHAIPSSLLGLGWMLSSCLFGVGALALPRAGAEPAAWLNRDRSLTAITLMVGLCVAAVVAGARHGLDGVALTGWTLLVLLLLLRQAHAVRRARRLTQELTLRERRLRVIVSEIRDAILQLDGTGRITYVSPALRHVLGREGSSALGLPVQDLIHPGDVALVREAIEDLTEGRRSDRRLQLRSSLADGTVIHIEALMTVMGSGLLVTVRDVTERVHLENLLHHAAYQDSLTDLPNRAAFDRALAARFDAEPTAAVGIVFLDLDGFKRINDNQGHPAGDSVLSQASRRIEGAIRPRDQAFRFGGDEFIVLLGPGSTSADGEAVAAAAIAALSEPLIVDGHETRLSATAGVSVSSTADAAELVRAADVAMYSAKGVRRGAVSVFEPQMLEDLSRKVDLERRFSRALESGELSLAYQPIVDLRTGQVAAAEALLRWRDHDGVDVGAEEFVPMAEGFGSIVTIGAWALREATAQAARWSAQGDPIDVSVNVSARQLLDTELVPVVQGALARSGLPAHRLCLEITESVLVADDEVAYLVLAKLRQLGVRLAIDDFGTGYSGLTYLRKLPVDQIKIDQSFLADAGEQTDGRPLLAAVVALGRDLGLTVTVEGVETPDQVDLLHRLRAHRGQGFLFSRPLDTETMAAHLRQRPPEVQSR